MKVNMLVETFPIKISSEIDARIDNVDVKIPLSAFDDVTLSKLAEKARVEIYRLARKPLPPLPLNNSFKSSIDDKSTLPKLMEEMRSSLD